MPARGGHQVHLLRRPHRQRAGPGARAGRRPRGHAGLRQRLHLAGAGLRRRRRSGQQRVAIARAQPALPHARRAGHRTRASTTCGIADETRAWRTNHELRPDPWQQTSWDCARRRQFRLRRRGQRPDACSPRSRARRARLRPLLLGWRWRWSASACSACLARARPSAACDERDLQSAHVVDVARGVRWHRCCSRQRRVGAVRRRRGSRRWRRCSRSASSYCQARIAAGRQGHSGLARAADRAAARRHRPDRRRRPVLAARALVGAGHAPLLWVAFGVLLACALCARGLWYRRLARSLPPRPLQAVDRAGHAFNAGSCCRWRSCWACWPRR